MKICYKISLLLSFLVATNLFAAKPTNAELKIGLTQEFENLNPVISTMSATNYISGAVLRELVDMDNKGQYYPSIVKTIPSLENGLAILKEKEENGIMVRWIEADWEIRPNVKWGDGTAVTGHDVEFAWKVGMSPNVSVGARTVYNDIKSFVIDEKNPKKFKMIHREAKWNFAQLLTFPIMPKHLEEKIFEKHKDQNGAYEKNSMYVNDPTNPGLYNGPYVITEVKLSSHVILERNKYFSDEKAKIEKIIFKVIPNSGTLEANLRSGNLDMISVLGLPFDQAIAFEKKVKMQKLPYLVKYMPGQIYEHIDLNLRNPLLEDVRVRQALVYGISREDLTNALFEGKQAPAIHNITPADPWYTDEVDKITLYKYSRRKAKKLLKEAGWELESDGYRYKAGEKLNIQIMTTSGNKTRELVETYLQDQWKKIGIDLTIKNQPARVFFGETTRKAQYPAMAMYAWTSSPESIPRSTLHSDSIPTKDNGYSGQNSGGWANKVVDESLDALELEFDGEERLKLIHQILGQYTYEVPVIPLYYRSNVAVLPVNMEGHVMTGNQAPNTNMIENWNLK